MLDHHANELVAVLREIRDELKRYNEGNEKERLAEHRQAGIIEKTLAQQQEVMTLQKTRMEEEQMKEQSRWPKQ